ncbi:MAG: tyrosine-type recombinase/integrase [Bdellovibrionaceae bacterium]|jgi:integrase/recombinase XerD|nr:tyrosine-type recombinase/integrase [Pseudobdellovibrionaceae bacterium]
MALTYWVDFFEDLELVRGRSKNTILAYRRDLELFDVFSSKEKELMHIYDYMSKQGLTQRSQARVISSIRTYLKFCELKGQKHPELRLLRPPKVTAALPKAITTEEFKKLLEASLVKDPYKSARNQITLYLLFGLGCRVTELTGMSLKDYAPIDSRIVVLGKGGKERILPLTQTLKGELEIYLKDVRPHLEKEEKQSLLLNDRGKRPSRIDVWRWLDAWSKRAGFERTISPHQFRHGCATALLDGGADLRSIQLLLGHTSIQTTQIYTNVSNKHLEETIKKHHPLSDV